MGRNNLKKQVFFIGIIALITVLFGSFTGIFSVYPLDAETSYEKSSSGGKELDSKMVSMDFSETYSTIKSTREGNVFAMYWNNEAWSCDGAGDYLCYGSESYCKSWCCLQGFSDDCENEFSSGTCQMDGYTHCYTATSSYGSANANVKLGYASSSTLKMYQYAPKAGNYYVNSFDIKYKCEGADKAYLYKNIKSWSEVGCDNQCGGCNGQSIPLSGIVTIQSASSLTYPSYAIVCWDRNDNNGYWTCVWKGAGALTDNRYLSTPVLFCAKNEDCIGSNICDKSSDNILDWHCKANPCIGITCHNKCEENIRYYAGYCEPSTGGCVYSTENCDDNNPDTLDKCENGICIYTVDPALYEALKLELAEKTAYIESLNLNIQEQAELLNQLELNLEEKAIAVQELQTEISSQAFLISELTTVSEEQGAIISAMELTNQEQVDLILQLTQNIETQTFLIWELESKEKAQAEIINNLEISIQEKAIIIGDLTSENDEQGIIINKLNLNLIEKAQIISQLEITTQEQADLINAMELSFSDQLELIQSLDLTIQEDQELIRNLDISVAEQNRLILELTGELETSRQEILALKGNIEAQAMIIKELGFSIEDQGELIASLKMSNQEMSSLILELNLTIQEKAEIIDNLKLSLEREAEIIRNLNLTLQEDAELIKQLNLKLEEEAILIVKLKLTVSEQQALIDFLNLSLEDREALLEKIAYYEKWGWFYDYWGLGVLGFLALIVFLKLKK